MDSSCVFCAIVAGRSPATRIFEDDRVLAFADIAPLETGHLLVIPKVHVPTIYELDEHDAAHVFRVTVRMAKIAKQVLRPDGLNLFQANEAAAGQEVGHFHMHVLPRWAERQPFRIVGGRRQASETELEPIFAPLREAVGRMPLPA